MKPLSSLLVPVALLSLAGLTLAARGESTRNGPVSVAAAD